MSGQLHVYMGSLLACFICLYITSMKLILNFTSCHLGKPVQIMADIKLWLEELNLEKYSGFFTKFGVRSQDDLKYMKPEDLDRDEFAEIPPIQKRILKVKVTEEVLSPRLKKLLFTVSPPKASNEPNHEKRETIKRKLFETDMGMCYNNHLNLYNIARSS